VTSWDLHLQVVSGRLFSEGLHVLGSAPKEPQLAQYLSAFFGDDLPDQARGMCRLPSLHRARKLNDVSFDRCPQN